MVTANLPVEADELAVSVRTLVDVAGFVLNAAVVPLPMPVAERVTGPAKLPDGLMVIVLVAFEPRGRMRSVGEAERVKEPGGKEEPTVSWIVVE